MPARGSASATDGKQVVSNVPNSTGKAGKTDPVMTAFLTQRPLLAAAFLFSAAMSLLALTTSFYMLQVYDRVLASRSLDTLLLLTLIAIVALAVFGVLDSLRLRLLMRVGLRVADDLSTRVFRAMVATTSQNGGVAARSGLRDVDTVRNFIGSPALSAMMDAPFVLVYLVVLLLLSPAFVVIVLVGGGAIVAIAMMTQRTTDAPLTRSILLSMRANETVEDGLRNADVLEGMGMSSTFVARWRGQWIRSQGAGTQASDQGSRFASASRVVRQFIQIGLLGTGAFLILNYQGSGGIMIAASIIGSRALAPIEALVSAWRSLTAVKLARERLAVLLEQAPRRDEGMALPAPSGRVQATAVHYSAAGSRKYILSNVSFELAAGQSMGVIGPSASGKSTLARLLVGAWPCSAGTVRLDGGDIYAWPRAALSKYIGYLPQDVELFAGTIRENIARMTDGDPDTVAQAALRAGAHDMILSLPKGYDTEIGTYGHALSGGQSQRIGLARALFGDPRLVVLDEPNSNLDSAGEDALVQTLAALKEGGITTVIVAHRPSILQNVDYLLVLRANGTVETFGPRAEVMQKFAQRAAVRPPANVVPLAPGTAP